MKGFFSDRLSVWLFSQDCNIMKGNYSSNSCWSNLDLQGESNIFNSLSEFACYRKDLAIILAEPEPAHSSAKVKGVVSCLYFHVERVVFRCKIPFHSVPVSFVRDVHTIFMFKPLQNFYDASFVLPLTFHNVYSHTQCNGEELTDRTSMQGLAKRNKVWQFTDSFSFLSFS